MSKYTDRVEQGLCGFCGKTNCDCKEQRRIKRKNKRQLKKTLGICRECDKPATNNRFCKSCWDKQKLIRQRMHRKSNYQTTYNVEWETLYDLYNQQGGCCALSGIPITIGVDATIDHIIPKCKGGKNVIENYQWVHKKVNKLKYVWPQTEFIEWCTLIAKHCEAGR